RSRPGPGTTTTSRRRGARRPGWGSRRSGPRRRGRWPAPPTPQPPNGASTRRPTRPSPACYRRAERPSAPLLAVRARSLGRGEVDVEPCAVARPASGGDGGDRARRDRYSDHCTDEPGDGGTDGEREQHHDRMEGDLSVHDEREQDVAFHLLHDED